MALVQTFMVRPARSDPRLVCHAPRIVPEPAGRGVMSCAGGLRCRRRVAVKGFEHVALTAHMQSFTVIGAQNGRAIRTISVAVPRTCRTQHSGDVGIRQTP